MWSMVVSLVQGIVTGVVGPVFTYLSKKQDVTLEGFKAATGADTASYGVYLDYLVRMASIQVQAASWWGPRMLYMVVGGSASIHAAAIYLDSTFERGWAIPAAPAPYDTYEAWVIGSLFVVSIAKGPLSAATAWLHRK